MKGWEEEAGGIMLKGKCDDDSCICTIGVGGGGGDGGVTG